MATADILEPLLVEWSTSPHFQQEVFETLFEDPVVLKCPVSAIYRFRVAKVIVKIVEDRGDEVLEDLLMVVLEGLSVGDSHSEYCYQTFGFVNSLDAEDVVCSIRVCARSMKHVGLVPWEAALLLGDYTAANASEFTGKHVLELGSGVGLNGILVSKLCSPKSVTMTDYEPMVLDNLRFNAELNCSNDIQVKKLDWTNAQSDLDKIDITLVADCVYDPALIPPLLTLLSGILHSNRNSFALCVTTERNRETFELFCTKLESSNIQILDETQALKNSDSPELFSYAKSFVLFNKFIDRSSVRLFRLTA